LEEIARWISVLAAWVLAASALGAPGQPALLEADGQGGLRKDGKAFRAIGVNYFSCFYRTLLDGDDTSYGQGFACGRPRRSFFYGSPR
jgi:hypothetical protein